MSAGKPLLFLLCVLRGIGIIRNERPIQYRKTIARGGFAAIEATPFLFQPQNHLLVFRLDGESLLFVVAERNAHATPSAVKGLQVSFGDQAFGHADFGRYLGPAVGGKPYTRPRSP